MELLTLFSNYYFKPEGVAWAAWDPELQHRDLTQATPEEKVNVEASAKKYAVSADIKSILDEVISSDVYQMLTQEGELDEVALEQSGFKILKDGGSRVIYHTEHPEWLIKIGAKEARMLPMEASVKVSEANRKKRDKDTVWRPLLNTNLLRPEGREYFISKLDSMSAEDRALFDFAEEFIYECPHAPAGAPAHKKYFSISKRKNTYTGKETVELIQDQEIKVQRYIAQKIIDVIKLTRMHDLHRGNLVLDKDAKRWCFSFIDNEPLGIRIDDKDTGASLLDPQEHVLFSLINFRDWYCRDNGLTILAEEADQAIVDYLKENPNLENKVTSNQTYLDPAPITNFQLLRMISLIVVSVLCPIIPLVLLIIAAAKTYCDSSKNHSRVDDFSSIYQETPGRRAFPLYA